MIPTQPTQNIATYASEAPAEMLIPPGGTPVPQEEYQDGVRPLDTLPAAWWNWLWQKFSLEEQNIVSVLNSFHSELVNLLTEGGITTPSESSVTQVAAAVKNIHERLATTSVAGSIKADNSTFGAIDVDSSTGVATMNGAGNGVLDTTPQDLTGAINELVSRIAALESAPAADSVPAGVMTAYGGETIPSGWLLCDGRALNRTTYASLFTAIGTKWGAGDGSTTFNIPDMREAVPVGIGQRASGVATHDTYTLGQFKDDQSQRFTLFLRTPTHNNNISATENVFGQDGSQPSQAYQHTVNASAKVYTSRPLYVRNYSDDSIRSYAAWNGSSWTENTGLRTGATNRTKQIGLNFIIKF